MKGSRRRNFIHCVSAICIIIFLAMTISTADHAAWDCPECGRTGNTGNYCGGCGHPSPTTLQIISISDGWSYQGATIRVEITGGNDPYELYCYPFINDNHNLGLTKYVGEKTFTGTYHTWIIEKVGIGQTYWILIKDSSGASIWQKHTVPRRESSRYSAEIGRIILKKWAKWERGAYSGEEITANTAEEIATSIKEEPKDVTAKEYGLQFEALINDLPRGAGVWSGGFILVLPNGDLLVNSGGLFDKGTYICGSDICFSTIYHYYNSIPIGVYKLLLIINGEIVGEEEFQLN